jgi:HK97 family phage major capsid protein/HK97 family phage prohead protease
MNRAYSLIEVKSFDDDSRTITGIATTPETDRVGDIVEPKGAQYKLPIPLLWQHRGDSPIGHVTAAKVTADGIEITAQIETMDEPGELKSLLDKAWQSIKKGLVRGLSIGFRPIESADIEGTYAQRFTKWEWLELSAVTIPANADATIQTVKQYDTDAQPSDKPGASGTKVLNLKPPKAREKMTATERVAALEAAITAKVARLDEIDDTVTKAGNTKDEKQREEYDTLKAEISSLTAELKDARDREEIQKSFAKPVPVTPAVPETPKPKAVDVRVSNPAEQKGLGFARYVMSLVNVKGQQHLIEYDAKSRWGDHANEVITIAKAAIAAGTATDATWAGPLVVTAPLNEFLDLLRNKTLLGRIPGLRRVPFNVSMPAQTAGGTYSWVGEGSAKPVTKADFSSVTLRFGKAAGIIVISQELARHSSPSAQETVRNELTEGIARYLDNQFIDPAVAAVANVSPASITNGVAGTAASGTTEAAARADLRALMATFATNNFGLDDVVLLMAQNVAFTLGTVVNSLGQTAFPGMNIDGGSLLGVPVVTSNVMTNQIVAVHTPSILYADEGGVQIDVSTEASLQMDSAPTNPTDATTVMVSMFQRNLIALRAEREIFWVKARANSVQRITGVAYA